MIIKENSDNNNKGLKGNLILKCENNALNKSRSSLAITFVILNNCRYIYRFIMLTNIESFCPTLILSIYTKLTTIFILSDAFQQTLLLLWNSSFNFFLFYFLILENTV